ncbi:hypothetical protein Sked_15890 [Sanguibacter keddieii DSM 10542]|uniref:Lipoprotein n=1 Tax=Sanguibacter keddieii (strain ATCC 51767 / DSM 10542 / NCFB 3025 / ST-74) TaxID=446469 RepID=D1BG13_SANKS|nr:hypothetical protein [Sanguibacter keddieii]ACZ21524.1 hypothetical protein Sked_15890 [Sanguibacter keddieii DSM 10542]
MLYRPACGLAAALVVSVLTGCTGDSDTPTTPSSTTSPTTSAAPPTAPPEYSPSPGETVVVTWLAVAPAADGDEAFDLTVQQLADIGYDVAPMDLSCQDAALPSLGLPDDPTARGVGLVFDDFGSSTEFASVWQGDIVGSVQSPLLCDLATG